LLLRTGFNRRLNTVKWGAAFAALLSCAACAPVNILNAITPSGSYNLSKNMAYGDQDRQNLDVYNAISAKADSPIIMFIHGGSWDSGSKDIYKFVGQGFAKDGYTVIIPNYRLYPEALFPDFIHDIALATAWTHRTYPKRKIILIGHSAGAHTALNLTLNDVFLRDAGVNRCAVIAGTVGLAGPYGERPFAKEPFITIFPDRNTGDDAPRNLARHPSPPLLLLTGAADTTVHPDNASLLAQKVTARGGLATSRSYAGVTHTDIVKVLSKFFEKDETVKADILAFIDALPKYADTHCQ